MAALPKPNYLMANKVKDYVALFPGTFKFKNTWRPTQMLGLEFEVEGANLPSQEDLRFYWNKVGDGSLRGEAGEYVLRTPNSSSYFLTKSFPYLLRAFNKKNSKVTMSVRCSTHVHVNVHGLYGYQVVFLAMLYYMYEETFLKLVHKDRKGNLFCLGASDFTGGFADLLVKSVENADCFLSIINNEGNKYSAVNFCTIRKFGTLEFRALHGTLDKTEVTNWVKLLLSLYTEASKIVPANMASYLDEVSIASPSGNLERVLADHPEIYRLLVERAGSTREIDNLFYKNIANIQTVFYMPAWHQLELGIKRPPEYFKTKKMDEFVNPFGAGVPIEERIRLEGHVR